MSIFDQIQNKVSILDIIGKVVQLKKKGNEFSGICPFHKEKSESFFVNNQKGLFFCFGCKEKGNMFHFMAKYKNIPLFDAAKQIANEFKIDIEINTKANKISQNIFDTINEVNKFFLKQSYNNITYQNFTRSRNITVPLGYAANNISLYEYARKNNLNINILKEIGLLTQYNKNVFFNRIIFPIINIQNQVIGFGGRVTDSQHKPKYLNSKESSIFHKKYILYGENIALKQHSNQIFVVEGYIDCIKMHQKEFYNTVAVLGTALTIFHLNKLWKYTKEIVIFFDGDLAGQKALKKTIELAIPYLEMGKHEITAIILKNNTDPDDFISKYNIDTINTHKILIEEIIFQLFIDTSNSITTRRSESSVEKLLLKMQSFSLKKKIFQHINKRIKEAQNPHLQNKSLKKLLTDTYMLNYIDRNILIVLGVKKFSQYLEEEMIINILNKIKLKSDFFNEIKKDILLKKTNQYLEDEAKHILELQNITSKRKVMIYLKIMLLKKDIEDPSTSYTNKLKLTEQINELLDLIN